MQKTKNFRCLIFVCFLLLPNIVSIMGQEIKELKNQLKNQQKQIEELQKKYLDLLEKMEEHGAKIEEQEQLKEQVENIGEDVDVLREDISSQAEDRDEQITDLEDEVAEMLDEIDPEASDERTIGLLESYVGSKIVSLSGYYTFEYFDEDRRGVHNRFRQHQLSLLLQKRVHDFNFFAEIEFEYAPKWQSNGTNIDLQRGEVNLERAWAEYLVDPLLNIRGGLMLMIDSWNTFHYPRSVYTTNRPIHVRRILPGDFIGMKIYGDTEDRLSEDFGIGYQLFIANGPTPDEGKNDINENKIIGGKLTLHLPKFNFLDEFDVGSILYYGMDANNDFDFIWNFEVIVKARGFTLHMEYVQGKRDFDAVGIETMRNYGGFVELGYTFYEKFSLFSRLEFLDIDRRTLDNEKRIIVGARYRPYPEIAFKGEFFRHWHRDSTLEDYNGFAFSFVFSF